ncbi:hypothetical protein ACJ72_02953 [Emergomyces africanus]|uniref:Calcineurin-like phosphoesterase domain-containing protein n=1 Tax=Emergomyces africanus TaxID=1955775 RepID=A0A1B7P125_9EURO|nr:hypothetical protein ACJ72_02953 [Emergomyces africanus]
MTRFLIIFDTHGMEFAPETEPLQLADAAIHCGDLPEESKLKEFESAIKLLARLNAPLKLVIAGNHVPLDISMFKHKVAEAQRQSRTCQDLFGHYGEDSQLYFDKRCISDCLRRPPTPSREDY